MEALSVLSRFLPDIGDLLLLIISGLLTIVTINSRKQVTRIDTFMEQNNEDHNNMVKKLAEMDTWTKSVHRMEIEPAFKKAKENEKKIAEVKSDLRDHHGRIKRIETKIGE